MNDSNWISVADQYPEPILMPTNRTTDNAVLIFTPVDGMMHVGWYLGTDWRGRPDWITATATGRSYQCLVKRVTHWMKILKPQE